MPRKSRKNHRAVAERLYDTAEAQQGYFTTKQAVAAGFDEKNHAYHVRAGNWIREHRGIYRLAQFPSSERPDLVLWSLWSRDRKGEPQGAFSHETALTIYDLSDVMPAKLHMTVPPAFRRSAVPKVLSLHRAALSKEDTESRQGYRVTKPLRTIADLIAEGAVQEDHLRQAVRQAAQRGLISPFELKRAKDLAPEVKKKIERLMAGK